MRELQARRRLRRFVYSKVTVVVLLILVIFVGRSVWSVYQKNRIANYHYVQSEIRLNELRERQSEIESDVRRLSSVRGREEEIRRTLPVAKEGERVIVILDQDLESGLEENLESAPKKSTWRDWFRVWFD